MHLGRLGVSICNIDCELSSSVDAIPHQRRNVSQDIYLISTGASLFPSSRLPHFHLSMRRVHITTYQQTSPLLLLFSLSVATARLVNRTIDDENGDSVTGVKPVYLPTVDPDSNWQQGATCTSCHLLPKRDIDLLQTIDGTWHDSTYTPGDLAHTINTPFSGTAIYVFFIVPNTVANTITYVNLTFLIDNKFSNSYEHIPDATSTILYNTLVFHATNLTNTEHNIEVRASGANSSLLMFDYMLYTVDEDDPSSSTLGSASATTLPASSNSPNPSPPGVEQDSRSSPPIGAIAGGVVGGVVVLSALLVLFCCLRKQRYRGFIPPRFTNWSKKPPVSLPTTTSMADTYNSPAAVLARPVTHPHLVSAQTVYT